VNYLRNLCCFAFDIAMGKEFFYNAAHCRQYFYELCCSIDFFPGMKYSVDPEQRQAFLYIREVVGEEEKFSNFSICKFYFLFSVQFVILLLIMSSNSGAKGRRKLAYDELGKSER
jgi:hypothetical protein